MILIKENVFKIKYMYNQDTTLLNKVVYCRKGDTVDK